MQPEGGNAEEGAVNGDGWGNTEEGAGELSLEGGGFLQQKRQLHDGWFHSHAAASSPSYSTSSLQPEPAL